MNSRWFVILLVATLHSVLVASEKPRIPEHNFSILGTPASTLLNINQISSWARNHGWSARDPASGNSGLFFPRGKVAAVFADGILWGGKVFDGGAQQLRVGGQTYSIGTIGGRILSRGVAANPSDTTVRIYRIRADYRTADLKQDAAELNRVSLSEITPAMIASVRAQYEKDWNEWPWQQGAPFYDTNNNRVRDPGEAAGLANADQVIWFVANDLNVGRTLALYGSNPIGFEMQVTLWGYRTEERPWSQTILKRVKLIYKGTATTPDTARIDSMFLAQWSDPDLGDAGDDFAGCDTTLGLSYVYNSRNPDLQYARFGWLTTPAVGYAVIQTPTVPGTAHDSAIVNLRFVRNKRHIPFFSMTYVRPTFGDPIPFSYENTKQFYNTLKGLVPATGRPFYHPSMPTDSTRFWLDGDPVTGTGRIDGILDRAGDRRFTASYGPFTMALGDTQEMVVATIAAMGPSNIQSISYLRANTIAVRTDYRYLLEDLAAHPDSSLPAIPVRFFLHQNFPNPFNPSTTIQYEVGYPIHVALRVVNILGQVVATLVDEEQEAGNYELRWNAATFPSGVYFYTIEAGPYYRVRKAMIIK